jgi:uncharacterized membrane protein
MEHSNYYGHPISVIQRKKDITANELKEMAEKREYRQAVVIAAVALAIIISIGAILSQFQGNVY